MSRRSSRFSALMLAGLADGSVLQLTSCGIRQARRPMQTRTCRLGPVDLPASKHHAMIHSSVKEVFMPGHPRMEMAMDRDGWLVGFSAQVIDGQVGYWVPPGAHARSRLVRFPFAGTVVLTTAHLHAHGQSLALEDVVQQRVVWTAQPVQGADGRPREIPMWWSSTGWHVDPTTTYRLTASYDNPTGEPIDAMGVLGAVVVPEHAVGD